MLIESKTVGAHQKNFATKEATRLSADEKESAPGRFAPVLELVLEEKPQAEQQPSGKK